MKSTTSLPFISLLSLTIMIFWACQLNAQDLEKQTGRQSEYDVFMDELNGMEKQGRFEEARILLLDSKDRYPDDWFKLAQEMVYLNEKTGRYEENLTIFIKGHEKGYFFFLHTQLPSCKPYLQYDAFEAIAERDMALRQEANEESEMTWEIHLPEQYNADKAWPMLMVLHGGGSSIDRAKEHWTSAHLSKNFITVFVRSYLHYDSDSYGWRKYDPRAREGLSDCYSALNAKYSIDTTSIGICGISAGATMAMDAYTSGIFPLKCVMAFSPSKPAEFDQQLSSAYVGTGKSAMILIGEDDAERRLQESDEMAEALDSAGTLTYLEIIPGLGHDYPDNFSLWINYALAHLYPEIDNTDTGKLKVIKLEGNAYEIGYLHGRLLKGEINEIIRRWKERLVMEYGWPAEVCIGKFFSGTSYIHDVHDHARELVEEIRGIADGAGIQFRTMLAFQMSEEFEIQGNSLLSQKCTTIAIQAGKRQAALVSQNMDPPKFLHGFPTVLNIKNTKTGLEAMVFTVPGLIGLNGMGRQGVAVACNGISMLNSDKTGLPVAFVMRRLLEMEDMDEAASFLESIKHASPQAYTFGDHDHVTCFECSAKACKSYMTFKEEGVVLHTNFSIANRDFNEAFISLLAEYGKTVDDPYFCPRFYLLYDVLKERGNSIDIEFLQEILRMIEPAEHPVLNEYTYGTTIVDLEDPPILLINAGKQADRFIPVSFEE